MKFFKSSFICAGAFAALSLLDSKAIAGMLYITSYGSNQGSIVNTNTLTSSSFTTGVATETAIAVMGTVRIMNGFASPTSRGSEYDLAGNVINAGIYGQNTFQSLYDGTTDGTYNYAIDHNGNGLNQVFRFDLNWQNSTQLFTTNQRSSGIAFDPISNTFWTTGGSGAPGGTIQQYSKTGSFISQFSPLSGNRYGLAFDSETGTLWTGNDFDGNSKLQQYSTTGVLLQNVAISGLTFDNPFGMEFRVGAAPASVPDSGSTLALLGFGFFLTAAGAIRRKFPRI